MYEDKGRRETENGSPGLCQSAGAVPESFRLISLPIIMMALGAMQAFKNKTPNGKLSPARYTYGFRETVETELTYALFSASGHKTALCPVLRVDAMQNPCPELSPLRFGKCSLGPRAKGQMPAEGMP